MILEQHYLGCLAHASYFVADEESGIAAVVDPQRDVERYLEASQRTGCRIAHVFLTHFHADFVAGHLELRDQTGATIHLGAGAEAEYPFEPIADGESLALGHAVRLQALATPGHSPESISLLVFDGEGTEPYAVLTGDTLFVGDVGRPDLRASLGWSAEQLGAMLYDSLRDKLLNLPDDTIVYPAHGPGTLCGRSLSAETVSTIGAQRAENYALQPMSRDEFVTIITSDQPDAPAYFSYDALLNTREHATLPASLERELTPLGLDELLARAQAGAQLLDTRPGEQYEPAHLRGAVNVALDGKYASWCGTVLESDRELLIIADPGREQEAVLRLGRIGFDRVAGYLDGGMAAVSDRPELLESIERLAPSALAERLGSAQAPLLVDVRAESELSDGTIDGALNVPLQRLASSLDELPAGRPVVAYCSSGYRSAVAASVLQASGRFERVGDLAGGYAAWSRSAGA